MKFALIIATAAALATPALAEEVGVGVGVGLVGAGATDRFILHVLVRFCVPSFLVL
jgi:hypothetical protein